MNPALHERARAVYSEACRQRPALRSTFVREVCADDPELRAEVESLLRFQSDSVETGAPFEAVPPGTLALRPGELFAGRYRIVELLGRGGMGDVYRAHDVLMDVEVALKRLRSPTSRDPRPVIEEVRMARGITHRAVCRMFDVGEARGEYYLTMEYVDGEDLGALLRRIGRFSPPKALEVARQLCAGLAAAHARGVLHRDLKPANVLIDGRGDVRITDFGIAVTIDASAHGERRGTPAYMAPELVRGAPASVQSDLYALGLVLFELVTGEHAFGPDPPLPLLRGPVRRPSSLVPDVDPRLDDAIVQALDEQPDRRPRSALALLAALPGGDLLQDALDAGTVPPRDLVAAAGTTGGLPLRLGLPLVSIALASLLAILTAPRFRLIDLGLAEEAPAALEAQARAFLSEATGTPPLPHRVFRLQADAKYLLYLRRTLDAPVDPPEAVRVVYRDALEPIVPALQLQTDRPFEVTLENPPLRTAGARAIVLDGRGRLQSFHAVPAPRSSLSQGSPDWTRFLRESGVDLASVVPTVPSDVARPYGTQRFAWRGRYPASPEVLRIEASSVGNAPTSFEVEHAWTHDGSAAGAARAQGLFGALFAVVVLGASFALAWRNLRSGSADLQGARRLGVVFFACLFGAAMLSATGLPVEVEVRRTLFVGSLALTMSILAGVVYVALEPIVRRRWPWSLIGWSRLLAGEWRDPLVGRDVLIGASASLVGTAAYFATVPFVPGLMPERTTTLAVSVFMGGRHLLAQCLSLVPNAAIGGMMLALIYTLLVMIVRRGWLAAMVLFALMTGALLAQAELSYIELVVVLLAQAIFVLVFARFGLLALVAYFVLEAVLADFPLSFSPEWRAEFSAVTVLVLLAILGLSGWTALQPHAARGPKEAPS